ncbi:phage gp6-like head-tail connector protein [Nocardiopsis gilva YIM 90087]|uniref:Phage gp6-like head-tail connector protein n=1 Tax=Nocardiopsis gilva YIM 90087 TaxID=1235441 RepID=A0A223S088_9ACTN|nr:head-tail connector protein [Nocardiopsis gilva]ASU81507.1 phage gp6-like head-tail connector protein [Nocardiopsis gilva YIM 90087]
MALGDAYATLASLKSYMGVTTASDDTELQDALDSVSREIERHCNRQFNKTTTAYARVFIPDMCGWAAVDDLHTTTDLVVETDANADGTYGTTWAAADYQLEPLNGIVDGQTGWPFYKIRSIKAKRFPVTGQEATLRVTAQWGWDAVPEPVRQACLILASETYNLRQAPFGVAGSDDFGVIRVRDNKMAAAKLARYCRYRILVG